MPCKDTKLFYSNKNSHFCENLVVLESKFERTVFELFNFVYYKDNTRMLRRYGENG